MSEKTLWMWLKKKVPADWHVVRIETSTFEGCPDVNYCTELGVEGWVELKHAPRVKRTGVPAWGHELTAQQEYFLLRRPKHSGILCQVQAQRFLIPAIQAKEFNAMTLEQLKQYDILPSWMTPVSTR